MTPPKDNPVHVELSDSAIPDKIEKEVSLPEISDLKATKLVKIKKNRDFKKLEKLDTNSLSHSDTKEQTLHNDESKPTEVVDVKEDMPRLPVVEVSKSISGPITVQGQIIANPFEKSIRG